MSLPSFISLYQKLISIPSISATDCDLDQSNLALINQLANWLIDLGFVVEISELKTAKNKFNLIATFSNHANQNEKSKGSKKSELDGGILFSGHSDTVPFDDALWESDPFKLVEKNNRIYGLGTADMKGFFAFLIEAIKEIDLTKLKKPLRILATADEETTMAGAQEIAEEKGFKPDYAVIGEPTGLVPVIMHKGHMSESIRITGKTGHSSDPSAGINAIEIMHLVIGELKKVQQQFKERYNNEHFKIPYPTLNFGAIKGGDNPNRICGCCDLHIDMRPIPNVSPAELFATVKTALAEIEKQYPQSIEITHLHPAIPAYQCDLDSEFVKRAEQLTAHKAQAVNYCTEAPFIQELGCQTIVLGPGHIAQAHQPNEYLDLSFVKPTKQIIKKLILHYCA